MRYWFGLAVLLTLMLRPQWASALDGDIRTHDPSTVIECDGTYYVYSTGRGIPIMTSTDAKTWKRAGRIFDKIPDEVHDAVPLNNGSLVWAPDVIKQRVDGGDQYFLYYSVSSWGSNVSAVALLTSPTLNPADPKYHWTDRGVVVASVKGENLNAIDPGVCRGPDGRMWLTYGSYIGNVQLLELDPKTGLRIAKDSPAPIVSSKSEASDLIYRDGWYYLFVNRGSCCKGVASTYEIRVGRSKDPMGPYLDHDGVNMARGGGDSFLKGTKAQVGPGHFGRVFIDGVEKFSCHYEFDDARKSSVLDIRPLLWTADGWPQAGENPSTQPAGTDKVK